MKQNNEVYFNVMSTNPHWKDKIRPIIQDIASKKFNEEKLREVFYLFNEKYCWRPKTPFHFKFKKGTSYHYLFKIYKYQLVQLCSDLAHILLQLQETIKPIQMVMGGRKGKYRITKAEIFYILIIMFFAIVPKQISDQAKFEQRFTFVNNFQHILSENQFKTRCLVQYFKSNIIQGHLRDIKGQFTILRNVLKQNQSCEEIILINEGKIMKKLILKQNNRSIQEFNGEIKIDFANRYIGGGSLTYGCVQQEIMFAIRPQLYATQLLCEKMESDESLSFIGFKRYFQYKGYGDNTSYNGPANVKYQISENNQAQEFITAIDAIKYSKGGEDQFQKKAIDRQIRKAYVGFSTFNIDKRIVTGGWGCGIYKGDSQLKLIIQWIAASLADKDMVFCPFGRKKLLQENSVIYKITQSSIKQVYQVLLLSCQHKVKMGSKISLFQVMDLKFLSKI